MTIRYLDPWALRRCQSLPNIEDCIWATVTKRSRKVHEYSLIGPLGVWQPSWLYWVSGRIIEARTRDIRHLKYAKSWSLDIQVPNKIRMSLGPKL